MNERIDDLLNQPLASVADDGFSARVMDQVRALQSRRLIVTIASVAACIVLALLILPLQTIGAELNAVVFTVAGNAAVSFAVAMLVLTFLLERQFSQL